MLLLLFLSLSILTGLLFLVSAIILFVVIWLDKTNGLSFSIAFVVLEIGLAFIGLPLTIFYQVLLPAGIAGFIHLLVTFGILVFRLAHDSINKDKTTSKAG